MTDNKCANGATLYLSENFAGEQINTPLQFFSSTPEAYTGCIKYFTCLDDIPCGRYYAQEGTNEKTPWQVAVWHEQMFALTGKESVDEIYVEWSEFFQSPYPWPKAGQKMFRAGYDHSQHPESKKEYGFSTLHSGSNIETEMFFGMWGNDDYGVIEWAEASGKAHPEDQWVRWKIWVRLNSPGQRDGFVRLSYNDKALVSIGEDLNLRGADERGFNYFWVGGNYSNHDASGSHGLPFSGSRYITDIRWLSTAPE